MAGGSDTDTLEGARAEIARLEVRIRELETTLIDTEAWAHRMVAESQERTYWLDRWHVDLNAVMQRPGADQFRAFVRAVRGVYRLSRRVRHAFGG